MKRKRLTKSGPRSNNHRHFDQNEFLLLLVVVVILLLLVGNPGNFLSPLVGNTVLGQTSY